MIRNHQCLMDTAIFKIVQCRNRNHLPPPKKKKTKTKSDKTSLKYQWLIISSWMEIPGKMSWSVSGTSWNDFSWQFITKTSWNSVRFTYSFISTWISSEPLHVTEGYLTSRSTYVVTPLRGCTNMHWGQFRRTSISVNNKCRYFFTL